MGVLMYFNRGGKLPWQGLKAKSKTQKYNRISKVKRETTIESLCQNCPKQFAEYLKYCRKLDFNGKPDYKYLRNLFKDLFKKKGYVNDGRYDWVIKATKISRADSHHITSKEKRHYSHGNGGSKSNNRHSNNYSNQQRISNVPPPPPNNNQIQTQSQAHVQYVNYLAQQRQEHQRRQLLAAQHQLQQGQPTNNHYSNQHHSTQQRTAIHKKLKKQQQGYYGHGVGDNNNKQNELSKKSKNSRRSTSKKDKQNYDNGHPPMSGKMMAEIHDSEKNINGRSKGKMPSNKLEDYYSTSSDDDEPNGNLDSSTSESSIVSDILREGANIPDISKLNGHEGTGNDVQQKKMSKKKEKKETKKRKGKRIKK